MKKCVLLAGAILLGITGRSQVSFTQLSVPYTQNFNTLSDTALNNPYSTLPTGWKAQEVGTGADATYRAAWGQLAGGDLYSFGDSSNTERALGSVGSGSVGPVYFGIPLVNNTGSTVNRIRISYRGELWRVGNPARSTGPDSLHFAYGLNNTGISGNTWTAYPALSFVSPAPAAGPANINLNGNAAAQVVTLTDTLINLNLASGDTLWLRWRDENSSSFDDGMGIDDISITFLPNPATSNFLSITAFNSFYFQNFDSLSKAYSPNASFSTLPKGWFAKEYGTNADNTYKVAYGEFAGGNIYSFGDSTSSDRALGSVGSGSIPIAHYGAAWINQTGQVIDNIEVRYMGEMWRQGRPQRATGPDTLHFSYSTQASGIDNGTFQNYSTLSFYAPVTNGPLSTPMNGNAAANRTYINGVINNLNLQPGDTVWVRWTDFDSDSFDDGLGIDSFSLAAVTTPALLNMEFHQAATTVQENTGIVSVPVVIHHKSNFLSQAEVFIADTGTVDLITDLNIASSYVSFPGTSTDTVAYFHFGVSNTEPFEGNEYFVLGLRNPVNGILGAIQYDTIRISNYQYPQVPIAALGSDNASGQADSLLRSYQVEGIVHGVNYSATGGVDFYVLQNGAGINVYQPTGSLYQPQAGDKVKVWGQVGQFRGLTRLEAIDSIQLISNGNTLETPATVTTVTENRESAYLYIDSLQLIPAIASWPTNLSVQAVRIPTHDTLTLYISGNTDLAGAAAPSGYFSITGIGSQFNSSTNPPFNNGYRLMAVSKNQTLPVAVHGPEMNKVSLLVAPNPFREQLQVTAAAVITEVMVYSIDGKEIYSAAPFNRQLRIGTGDWKPGLYLLHCRTEKGNAVHKIIKH